MNVSHSARPPSDKVVTVSNVNEVSVDIDKFGAVAPITLAVEGSRLGAGQASAVLPAHAGHRGAWLGEPSAVMLARIGEARKALAEVETIEGSIRIAGFAEAVAHAARQARAGVELENAATEVRLRAERRAGELLAGIEKRKGTRGQLAGRTASGGLRMEPPEAVGLALADLGVSKRQSAVFQQVAAVAEEVFEEYVRAPNGRLSRNALFREGKRAGQYEPVAPPPLPKGAWNVLLADPPWRYEPNSTLPAYFIENYYPTLTLEEICSLEVPAAEDAVLFLWATAPKLPDALEVMAAWGFGAPHKRRLGEAPAWDGLLLPRPPRAAAGRAPRRHARAAGEPPCRLGDRGAPRATLGEAGLRLRAARGDVSDRGEA